MAAEYSQILDLDKIDVYLEDDAQDPQYFNISDLPSILTFGKHYFTISFNDPENTNLYLKESSNVLFEFKDSRGTVMFSDLTTFNSVDGAAIGYVWIKENPSYTRYNIRDGIGTLTIVGELENTPPKYTNAYNIRLTIPFEIRKNLPNISPILFQSSSLIQTSMNFSESIETDTNDSNYKRSYINVSASNLQTVGGKLSSIELSYNETRAKNNEYKILTTYPLSSSVYEITGSESNGLNPISDLQKFPMPRDLRRNGNVEFRLKFLNVNGEYAQDISQNNVDVTITGSISNFTGSAVILETADNLVTSSGAFVFGKDVDNGIRMDFKPTGEGNVKGSDTIEFTRVVAGVDDKAIYALSDKGEIINDIETNKVSGSDNSSIIASVESVVSSSTFGSIMASSGSSIKYSPLSVVIGGQNQKIHNPTDNTSDTGNVVIGGGTNIISSSFTTDKVVNSIILGGAVNNIRQIDSVQDINSGIIIGGLNNAINTGLFPVILSGNGNLISGSSTNSSIILGGSNNKLIHDNSIIIGKSSFTSTADNTVYINNLDVDGTITANEFHTTYTSASIIYASGSTQFGDTLDDIHNFTGSVNITGSLNVDGNTTFGDNISHLHQFTGSVKFNGTDSIMTPGVYYSAMTNRIMFCGTTDTLVNNGTDIPTKFTIHDQGNFLTASHGMFKYDDSALSAVSQYAARSRGSYGSSTATQDGDLIYRFTALGHDGTDNIAVGMLDFIQDGVGGSNDLPGKFVISTTASGSATATSRVTIKSDGKVGIGTTSPSKELTVNGDISGSGQVYAVSASFGELSNTTNRWTDGSNGNDEFIALTPSDFALTDTYSRGDEFPHYTDDNGGSIRPSSAAANYFALKMIPKGFTAIEVYIYSDSSDTITVYEGNIANATATSKGIGNTNTTINITDVDGDGTNYLSIKWNPSSTFDNIYGGKINIQRTT